jgi:nitrogen fixation protein NifU and related proteins
VQVESMYQEIILDHYKNPQGKGLREPFNGEAHHVNPSCGDEVTVRVKLSENGDVVEDISYDGVGCSISQASVSVLHELVNGRPVVEAFDKMTAFTELMQSKGAAEPDEDVLEDGVAFVGVAKFPSRIKCALLGWMAFKDAAARAGANVPEGK